MDQHYSNCAYHHLCIETGVLNLIFCRNFDAKHLLKLSKLLFPKVLVSFKPVYYFKCLNFFFSFNEYRRSTTNNAMITSVYLVIFMC